MCRGRLTQRQELSVLWSSWNGVSRTSSSLHMSRGVMPLPELRPRHHQVFMKRGTLSCLHQVPSLQGSCSTRLCSTTSLHPMSTSQDTSKSKGKWFLQLCLTSGLSRSKYLGLAWSGEDVCHIHCPDGKAEDQSRQITCSRLSSVDSLH